MIARFEVGQMPPWTPAGELNSERRRQRIEKRRQRSRPASAPSTAGHRRKEKALDEAVDLERSRNISRQQEARSRRREAAGALQSDLAPLLSDGLPPKTGQVSMEQYLALEGRCKALEASLSSLSVSAIGSELAQ